MAKCDSLPSPPRAAEVLAEEQGGNFKANAPLCLFTGYHAQEGRLPLRAGKPEK